MINPIGTKTTRREIINTMFIIVELEEFRITFSGGLTFLNNSRVQGLSLIHLDNYHIWIKLSGLDVRKGKI